MRVVSVDAIVKTAALASEILDARARIARRAVVAVEVVTDDGVSGWGEAACFGGCEDLVRHAVEHLSSRVIGRDLHPRDLGRSLLDGSVHYGQRGVVVSAISGIEIALWDAHARAAKLSVSALFGAAHRPVRWYATTGFYRSLEPRDSLSHLRDDLDAALAADPAGVKIKVGRFGVHDAIARATSARDRIGPDQLLIIDANNAFSVPDAIQVMRGVRELGLTFFEEPIPVGNPAASAELRARGCVPVGGYELEPTYEGCSPYVLRRAVDVVQPDVCWSGGIAETLAIAELARREGVACVPHNFSSVLATAGNYHVVNVSGGDLVEIDLTGNPLGGPDLLRRMGWRVAGGYLEPPSAAGLGLVDVADWVADGR